MFYKKNPKGPTKVVSTTAKFEISAVHATNLTTGISLHPEGMFISAPYMQIDQGKKNAVAILLQETDPTFGEMEAKNMLRLGRLPDEAIELFGFFANYLVELDPRTWIVARLPEALWIGNDESSGVVKLPFLRKQQMVLTPLAEAEDHLILPAIFGNQRTASLCLSRISAPPDNAQITSQFKKIMALPIMPACAEATLSPHSQGSHVVIALSWPTKGGTTLRIVELGSGDAVKSNWQVTVPGLIPVPNLKPAVWVTEKGVVVGLYILRDINQTTVETYYAVEWQPNRRERNQVKPLSKPIQLTSGFLDGQVALFEGYEQPITRCVVLRDKKGSVVMLDDSGEISIPISEISPDQPFVLIPGRDCWYAVWLEATGPKVGRL